MRAKLRVCWPASSRNSMPRRRLLDRQLTEIGEEMHAQGEAVQQMEAEHGERTQRGYAIERESQENREKLNTLALEIDRAAARRRTNEERCAELDARSAGAQAEIGNTEEQVARLQQELETNRATLESANAEVADAQQELQQQAAGSFGRGSLADRCRAPAGSSGATRFCRPSPRLRRAQPHHAGRRAHCRARSRSAAPARRNRRRQSAAGNLRRPARTARLGVRIRLAARRRAHRADRRDAPAARREARRRDRRQAPSGFPARRVRQR